MAGRQMIRQEEEQGGEVVEEGGEEEEEEEEEEVGGGRRRGGGGRLLASPSYNLGLRAGSVTGVSSQSDGLETDRESIRSSFR